MRTETSQPQNKMNYSIEKNGSEFFPSHVLKMIERLSTRHTYPRGIEIFQQGSDARVLYFIESGIIKLRRTEENGNQLIVDLRFPGWLLGAAAAIMQSQHPVTAITLTRCGLDCLTHDVFLQALKTDTEFSWHIHRMNGHETLNQCARITSLACLSARQRLENWLWKSSGGPLRELSDLESLRFCEIAELIAVTPEHLSRLMRQLEGEGILRRQKGSPIAVDRDKLSHQSDY